MLYWDGYMKYYVDKDEEEFLEGHVEEVIRLIVKAYFSTKEFYKDRLEVCPDFLYFNANKTFSNGYCFYFARILKSIYKNASFVVYDEAYAHISHIYTLINNETYDVHGKCNLQKYHILTNDELKLISKNHKSIDDEIDDVLKKYFYEYLNEYKNKLINFTGYSKTM